MDGHTYQRSAIEQWLETNSTSPKTNKELPSKQLIPNLALKSVIRTWMEKNPKHPDVLEANEKPD